MGITSTRKEDLKLQVRIPVEQIIINPGTQIANMTAFKQSLNKAKNVKSLFIYNPDVSIKVNTDLQCHSINNVHLYYVSNNFTVDLINFLKINPQIDRLILSMHLNHKSDVKNMEKFLKDIRNFKKLILELQVSFGASELIKNFIEFEFPDNIISISLSYCNKLGELNQLLDKLLKKPHFQVISINDTNLSNLIPVHQDYVSDISLEKSAAYFVPEIKLPEQINELLVPETDLLQFSSGLAITALSCSLSDERQGQKYLEKFQSFKNLKNFQLIIGKTIDQERFLPKLFAGLKELRLNSLTLRKQFETIAGIYAPFTFKAIKYLQGYLALRNNYIKSLHIGPLSDAVALRLLDFLRDQKKSLNGFSLTLEMQEQEQTNIIFSKICTLMQNYPNFICQVVNAHSPKEYWPMKLYRPVSIEYNYLYERNKANCYQMQANTQVFPYEELLPELQENVRNFFSSYDLIATTFTAKSQHEEITREEIYKKIIAEEFGDPEEVMLINNYNRFYSAYKDTDYHSYKDLYQGISYKSYEAINLSIPLGLYEIVETQLAKQNEKLKEKLVYQIILYGIKYRHWLHLIEKYPHLFPAKEAIDALIVNCQYRHALVLIAKIAQIDEVIRKSDTKTSERKNLANEFVLLRNELSEFLKIELIKSTLYHAQSNAYDFYNDPDFNGKSLLIFAAFKTVDMTTIKLLVDSGCDVNTEEMGSKKTALHYAAINKNEELIKFLLSHRAAIWPDSGDKYPYDYLGETDLAIKSLFQPGKITYQVAPGKTEKELCAVKEKISPYINMSKGKFVEPEDWLFDQEDELSQENDLKIENNELKPAS